MVKSSITRRKVMLFVFTFTFVWQISGQDKPVVYPVINYPVLPDHQIIDSHIEETSALIWFRNYLWTLNDSGNLPELYKIDKKTGAIIQTVVIENVKNNDWEELTQDDRYIYVGDFGNNRGNRTDLAIYKIDKSKIPDAGNCKVMAEIIKIKYANQLKLSANHKHNFDCEAMISFGNSLLLFTKNRENLKTTQYAVPKIPGSYNLQPLGSFNVDGLVTGASLNVDNNKLALIGYIYKNMVPFLFIIDNFNGDITKVENVYRFDLIRMKDAQTEGICWINDHEIYISAEKTDRFDQTLYHLDLKKVFELTKLE